MFVPFLTPKIDGSKSKSTSSSSSNGPSSTRISGDGPTTAPPPPPPPSQPRVKIPYMLVVVLVLYLLLQPCNAWAITVGVGVQCLNLSLTISGTDGSPPYHLKLIPDEISPTSRINTYNFSGDHITFPLKYTGSTTLTAVAHDSAGSASVSSPFVVGGGDDDSCLPSATEQALFQLYLSTDDPTVGIPSRIWWDTNHTSGLPKFFGFIPAPNLGLLDLDPRAPPHGTYFDIPTQNVSDLAGQGRGFDWIPSIAPDSDVVIIGSDSRGPGAGNLLKTHVQSGAQICVFPMSGTYQRAQRIVYDVILAFAMALRHKSFLVGLVIGGAIILACTSAIHAFGLASTTLDLDVFGVFQILVVTCCAQAGLVVSLSERSARRRTARGDAAHVLRTPHMRATLVLLFFWLLIIWAGLVCMVATLQLYPQKGYTPACFPSNITNALGVTVTKAVDLSHCAAYCSTATAKFRDAGSALALPAQDIARVRDYALVTSVVALLFGAVVMFWILALALRRKESHYARPVLYGILTLGWMGFIAAIVAGEYLLAKKSISSGEPLYAIGQWGPLVAVGLTVVVGYLHPGLECFFTKARGNKERSKV